MQLEVLTRCAPARPIVLAAFADLLKPAPKLTPSQWAEAHRVVSAESGSRYPGPWRNDRTPHLVEVLDALGPDDPAEDVVFVASAQVGKSETAINWFGYVVDHDPGPMIMVLPSHDESIKYVRTKMQPAIDETPRLRAKVLEATNREERGSTASFKRFRGGYAQVTFAGSSKGLQMLSARYTIGDELSEWPAEAGERGDPAAQLKKRTETYERDRKRFWVSTPSILGACRITTMFGESDQRRRYVPCPHCGAWQVLTFDRLRWDSDVWPHRAWFECQAHGCVIGHADKPAMMQRGQWVATAGDDGPGAWFGPDEIETWRARNVPTRVRGFHIWKAYSLFTSWDSIVAEWLADRDNQARHQVFTQQVLGEAWEDKGDAPDAEKLHARRVLEIQRGAPPLGPVVLTGATDVQGNRLEWAVWGWSEGMTRWLIDWGVIEGDPEDAGTWARHDEVLNRSYSPGGGKAMQASLWAVDAGYKSHMVYNYTRGRPAVMAVDGRAGRSEPFVGTPKKVDIKWSGNKVRRGATLWPVGGFALKSDLYAAIRRTIAGPDENGAWRPGAMILPGDVDLAYAEQLTAEFLDTVERRSGVIDHEWKKLKGRQNEALDVACYARAAAYRLGLDRLGADQWANLRAEHCGSAGGDAKQADLFEVAIALPAAPVNATATAAKAAQPKQAAPKAQADDWLGGRGNWR